VGVDGSLHDAQQLEHVEAEAPGRPSAVTFGIERARSAAGRSCLDLGKVLLERVEQDGDPGLAVVA